MLLVNSKIYKLKRGAPLTHIFLTLQINKMTKKHFVYAADRVADYFIENRSKTPFQTDIYIAFVDLFTEFADKFDCQSFDTYILKKIDQLS